MAKNKLIKTDSFLYKINRFFNKLFHGNNANKSDLNGIIKENLEYIEDFKKNKILKNEFEDLTRNNDLTRKLLNNEITCDELSDVEVDYVTEILNSEIEKMDKELIRIKENIIRMRKKLEKK